MGEAQAMMGFVAGRVALPVTRLRRVLGRCMAMAALGLATLAEKLLDDGRPAAALNLGQGPWPATQELAVWNGKEWLPVTLSLN